MSDIDPTAPLSVIVVSSGSRGSRVLYRYPYHIEKYRHESSPSVSRNPYTVTIAEMFSSDKTSEDDSTESATCITTAYSESTLASMLATNAEHCGKKFDVKCDNIRFIGFPTRIQRDSSRPRPESQELPTIRLFNVVFAIQSSSDSYLSSCYEDLARRLSAGIQHEERRCNYLTSQAVIMMSCIDDVSAMPEDSGVSPFQLMLDISVLAKTFKSVYDSLHADGIVQVFINSRVEISFCLPHKVHNVSDSSYRRPIQPQSLSEFLGAVRPYHALMLLEDEHRLIGQLPPDCSPALIRLIHVTTPMKNLQTLALDADLAISQVFQLVAHLVYWAKATVIYPLCESNVYVLSTNITNLVDGKLMKEFQRSFPSGSLPALLSEFSLPTPLSRHRNPVDMLQQQKLLIEMVIWMLQHRILMQLHTYVFMMPPTGKHRYSISEGQRVWCLGTEGLDGGFRPNENSMVLLNDLSPDAMMAVLSCPAASSDDDLALFARVHRHYNGQHHLEDIMYHYNISRSQLLANIDKFRDVLVTCTHEEPSDIFHRVHSDH